MSNIIILDRCKHGMDRRFCAICNRDILAKYKQPAKRDTSGRRRRAEGIPSLFLWSTYIETLPQPVKRLCVLCHAPLPLFTGIRKIGRRDGFDKVEEGRITLGSLVKVTETFIEEIYGQKVERISDKVIPMFKSGIGCGDCQYRYAKAEAEEGRRFASVDRNYLDAIAIPSRRKLLMDLGAASAPTKRQAFIDIANDIFIWAETPEGMERLDTLRARFAKEKA